MTCTAGVDGVQVVQPRWRTRRVSPAGQLGQVAAQRLRSHPRVDRLLLNCETLVGLDHQQRLMVLTPADHESRERLELLQVLGLQDFNQGAQ